MSPGKRLSSFRAERDWPKLICIQQQSEAVRLYAGSSQKRFFKIGIDDGYSEVPVETSVYTQDPLPGSITAMAIFRQLTR
jgi:hypothetical protein